MGAWGLKMFQSDIDFDLVSDLDGELGLYKLAEEANYAASKAEKPPKSKNKAADAADDEEICYSIYAESCSSEQAVDVVKKHLEAGKLAELVAKYEQKMKASTKEFIPGEYMLCLVGACAMSLGCTLASSFTDLLKRIYATAGLMRDGKTQMKKALFGPDGYTNGVRYDFSSKGLQDTMASGGPPEEDRMYPGSMMMNVQSPFGFPPLPPKSMEGLRKKRRADAAGTAEYSNELCGGCGKAEKPSGAPLMKCGRCKLRQYCGTNCQKQHWQKHKAVCQAAKDPAEGGAKA